MNWNANIFAETIAIKTSSTRWSGLILNWNANNSVFSSAINNLKFLQSMSRYLKFYYFFGGQRAFQFAMDLGLQDWRSKKKNPEHSRNNTVVWWLYEKGPS